MRFMFIHPEFVFWMSLPIIVLFYFWQTQKGDRDTAFSPKALERLRAPAATMGLAGRNGLFFAASLLLIMAMAQPVLSENQPGITPKSDVVLAIDISEQSIENFDHSKEVAIALLSALKGENIGIVAYDETPYRISPLSQDGATLTKLVRGLDEGVMHMRGSDLNVLIESLVRIRDTDEPLSIVPISFKPLLPVEKREGITVVETHRGEPLSAVLALIHDERNRNRLIAHTPLFYYPLGMAMVLIWFALSSMSKRRSVPLVSVIAFFVFHPSQNHAGILDFRILDEARMSYEQGEYERSAEHFAAYQKMHDTPQIRYNRANALYKAGRYEEARIGYERVYTTNTVLREHTRYNLACTMEMIERRGPQGGVKNPEGETNDSSGTDSRGRMKKGEDHSGFKTRLFRID